MHLNRLKINNFKSLSDVDIEPKKFTILIGPNSGGKSSILQALAVLKQSVANSIGNFLPSGDVVNLGKFSDVVSNHNEQSIISILTGGNVFLEKEYENAFSDNSLASFFYRFSVGRQGAESAYCQMKQGELEAEFENTRGNLTRNKLKFGSGTGKFKIQNNNGILPSVSIAEAPQISDKVKDAINHLFSNSLFIQSLFENYFYIPPSRIMDEYSVPIVGVHNNQITTSQGQQILMSQLVSYLSSSPPRSDRYDF